MEQFAPAVGPDTAILPILSGMAHLDALQATPILDLARTHVAPYEAGRHGR